MRCEKILRIILIVCIFLQSISVYGYTTDGNNPYEWICAASFDESNNSQIQAQARAVSGEEYVLNISSGDYLCYENLSFSDEPFFIDMRIGAAKGNNGTVDVYLDSLNGKKIATVTVDAEMDSFETGENYRAEVFADNIYGNHTIYFAFNNASMSFHKFKFLTDYEYKEAYDWVYPSSEDGMTSAGNFGIYKNETTDSTLNEQQEGILCFKNYCFNQSTDFVEILLENKNECGNTIEIRIDSPTGDLITTVDTYAGNNENNSVRKYFKPVNLTIYREHDIYIIWKTADVTFYGLRFHQTDKTIETVTKDGLEFINPHSFDSYSGQKIDYENRMQSSYGFMREYSEGYGHRIAYVKPGLTLMYKDVYFKDAPTEFNIKLGTYKNTTEKVEVYIDGVLLKTLDTTKTGVYYDTPSDYIANISEIEANSTHDITIKILNEGINFYGFQFTAYEQKNGLSFINPQNWDETSGKLNTGTPDANLGFTHENDASGAPMVSYIAAGTKFEYKNLYFENAPETLTLYVMTTYVNQKIDVTLTDGTVLGSVTTTAGGSWSKPAPYQIDVTGKIAAGSTCGIVIKCTTGGYNFGGIQFSAETVKYDAESKIVLLNSTPDMVGKSAIIGSYTNGARFVNAMKRNITYTVGKPQTIDISEILTGADKIKVLIWENLSTLIPYMESKEFNIKTN